jgi:hypothetical protein
MDHVIGTRPSQRLPVGVGCKTGLVVKVVVDEAVEIDE